MLFLDADIRYRNTFCDSCHGVIGGARLFCVDCVPEPTAESNVVNLCCEPQCVTAVAALMPPPPDMEVAHKPNHRLVKARIPVLLRHYGRIHSAALEAFDRSRYACMRIAESTAHPQEEEKTGSVEPETPNHEPTFAEIPANVDKVDDTPTAPHGDEKTGSVGEETPNLEPTSAELPASVDRVNDAPSAPQEEEETGLVGQETPNHEPTFGEIPADVDKVDDAPTAPQEEEEAGSVVQETPNHEPPFSEIPASVYSVIIEDLPTCGNCNGRLSFPCWYCIFCIGKFPKMKLLPGF